MPLIQPGAQNVYIPNLDASGRLQVDFVRNPKKFKLAKYAQYKTVTQTRGVYSRMGLEQQARIVLDDLADFSWPDNADLPIAYNALEGFEFVPYELQRFAYTFTAGYLTIDQAAWDFANVQQSKALQQAATGRTVKTLRLLTNPANWGTHVQNVQTIPGNSGAWNVSTAQRQDIKRSIDWVRNEIRLATTSAFDVESDLMMVINPLDAAAIAESQEIADYVKGSPYSLPRIAERGPEWPKALGGSGLPPYLYNMEVLIEDAVRVSSIKGASTVSSFAMPRGMALILARPGGIDAPPGGPTFSTLTIMVYEGDDMAVGQYDDSNSRKRYYRIVDHFEPVLTAPISGYLLTGIYQAPTP